MPDESFDLTQVLYGLAAAAIGFGVSRTLQWWRSQLRTKGQSALFNGIEGPTIFVYSPREGARESLLPLISTEDFLAINNVISALIAVKADVQIKMRDSEHLTEDDKKRSNLILICSSKTNSVTRDALEQLRESSPRMNDLVPLFVEDKTEKRVSVQWNGGIFPSLSYDQDSEEEKKDIGIIVKARNPWAGQRKVLIVAGCRGFGTWGVAECLKKWWRPLHSAKGRSRPNGTSKSGDFAALLEVTYKQYDIKEAKLVNLVNLDGNTV